MGIILLFQVPVAETVAVAITVTVTTSVTGLADTGPFPLFRHFTLSLQVLFQISGRKKILSS